MAPLNPEDVNGKGHAITLLLGSRETTQQLHTFTSMQLLCELPSFYTSTVLSHWVAQSGLQYAGVYT